MEEFIVELEDQGQDLLRLVLNKDSIVIATEPSHIENYIGAKFADNNKIGKQPMLIKEEVTQNYIDETKLTLKYKVTCIRMRSY